MEKELRYLIVSETQSAGSSEPHSGKAEVRTETFHARFIDKRMIGQTFT